MPPLLLFVTDWIEPDTNASAARQLALPLSWSNPFNPSKIRFSFQNLYGSFDESSSLICCSCFPNHSSMPLLIQRSVSSSLPLVARRLHCLFFFLSRTLRSFKLLIPLSESFFHPSPTCSSSCCTTVRFFVRVCFSSLLGCCLPVIDAYVSYQIPLLSKPVSFPLRYTRSLAFPTTPSAFARFRFLASRFICLNCVSNVLSCLDPCALDLCGLLCASSFLSH